MWAQTPTGRVGAHALGAEVRRAVHQLGRDDAVLDDALVVVEVVDEQVEGAEPLDEAGLESVPLVGGDDPGDDVERPGPVDARVVAVDLKRHPDPSDLLVGGSLSIDSVRADPAAAQGGDQFGGDHWGCPPAPRSSSRPRAGR